jgi:hypothetical protein
MDPTVVRMPGETEHVPLEQHNMKTGQAIVIYDHTI